MYRGKRAERKAPPKKWMVLLASLMVLLVLAVGGTVAFLFTESDPFTNTFRPGEVNIVVQPDRTVQNTGNIPVYIRAAVVTSWVDADGNLYWKQPDANVTATGWKQHTDGFYYWPTSVAANASTDAITASASESMEGYTFTVEILAQAIQADGGYVNGTSAVVDAWGVDPETLKK